MAQSLDLSLGNAAAFVTLPTPYSSAVLRGAQYSSAKVEQPSTSTSSSFGVSAAVVGSAVAVASFAVARGYLRKTSRVSRRCYLKPARGDNVNQGYPVKGEEWPGEFAEVEEGKKYQNAFDDFNPNYPLSSPDQPRTEVSSEDIPRPEDIVDTSAFPMFSGSTNGYMSSSTRERHAITWTGKDEAMFEMPTKGMAIMNKGKNLCYFRRKEQCIALCKQLRNMKIQDVKIYRVAKDGKVTLLHPSDGVYPEKVNKGRVPVNFRPFSARGEVPNFAIRDSEYFGKPWEADPLTIMFSKARWYAMGDKTNLFPMPNPKLTSGPVDANYPNVVDYKQLIEEAKADQTARIQKAIADISSTGKSL